MIKQTMVFCKNCKYLNSEWVAHFCEHKSNVIIKYNYYKRYERFSKRPDQINKRNNCKHFENK